jgi:hypothetical protein
MFWTWTSSPGENMKVSRNIRLFDGRSSTLSHRSK